MAQAGDVDATGGEGKALGSTFGKELVAAGLGEVGVTWNPLTFDDGVSEADRAAVMAIVKAHDPAKAQVQDEIAAMERDNPISHRALREFIITACAEVGINMQSNAALKKVADVDAAIAVLRGRMT